MSIRYAGGNDALLAVHAPREMQQMPLDEILLVLGATRILAKTPGFTNELYNGDVQPMVEKAMERARELRMQI